MVDEVQTSVDKRTFLYLPKSVQNEIEKFRRRKGLKSQSAAARAMLHYAAKMIREADNAGAEHLYMPFVEMELPPLETAD